MSHSHVYLPNDNHYHIMPNLPFDGSLLFVFLIFGILAVVVCWCPWDNTTGRRPRHVYVPAYETVYIPAYESSSSDEEDV